MTTEYWTVNHDYDWHTPAELQVYRVSYATEALAVDAAKRLLRYLLWQGCISKPRRIKYSWPWCGASGWKDIFETSHDTGDIRPCSIAEVINSNEVMLNYKIESRELKVQTAYVSVDVDGETYTRPTREVTCGPWLPLLGRAHGEEWQHLRGTLRAYVQHHEIIGDLPSVNL